jgi:thioredoxin-related protein
LRIKAYIYYSITIIMKSIFVTLLVLISFGSFAQTTPEASSTVMNAAYAKAKAEHKNVILMFHASWCGWCKKMEASINDSTCRKSFNDNYVIVYLDILENKGKENLENAGGIDMLKSFGGDPAGGIPFWVIIDANGKSLGNSYLPPADGSKATAKDNVGCPAADNEVAYFAGLLKSTSKLTDAQLAIIKTRFRKNNPTSAAVN